MLGRIWQRIVKWFQNLFGGRQNPKMPPVPKPPKPLDESDYEYLFMQLLEGVTHGWQQQRVVKFFNASKDRISTAQWVTWLRGFGERLLASPIPNNELAARMVQLGELGCGKVGDVALEIGMQLLVRNAPQTPVYEEETDGQDTDAIIDLRPVYEYEEVGRGEETFSQESQEAPEMQQVSLEELSVMLQQDPSFVEQVARQLQIETTDPQVIIDALVNQFNAATQAAANEVETLLEQSVRQFQSGDSDAAIASVESAIEIAPNNYGVWYSRGDLMGILRRYEEAIASYDKATQINPDFYEAWYNRGLALKELGRTEEAIASYDKAIQINPDYYEAWYNRSVALTDLGRNEEAIASHNKAIELKPDQA